MTARICSLRKLIDSGMTAWVAPLLLVACIQAPIDETSELPPLQSGSPNLAFETRQRERALDAVRREHYGEAAIAWEILTVLRPEIGYYRARLEQAKSRARSIATMCIQNGHKAKARGELSQAAQWYLQALAAMPDNVAAAESLRAIERERNKRNYLNKPSRTASARPTLAYDDAGTPTPENLDRNELEHAMLLMRQGDDAEAIRLLERYQEAYLHNDAARRAFAEVSCEYVEKLAAAKATRANTPLEKCQRYDPDEPSTRQRLSEFKPSQP